MATKINERKMVEDNLQLYEEKLQSPIRRYTDKSFVPTFYWNIKGNDTTVDEGFGDVAMVIGPDSPIRYNAIDGLPIYGLDTMTLQIQSGELGLDTTYEADGVVMERTIRPYANDFFMIPVLKDPLIFRITGVEYDKLASASTYKIQFCLEYIDHEKIAELMRQTVREYVCILENIGTSERCIIEKSDYGLIQKINSMYEAIVSTYMAFFFNSRYNCFLADFEGGRKLYDPLQEEFIRRHRLFNQRNQIDGLVLITQFKDPKMELKYHKSIYRMVEMRRKKYLCNFPYTVYPGMRKVESAFYAWSDGKVVIMENPKFNPDTTDKTYNLLPDEFIHAVDSGEELSIHADLIRRWINGEELSLRDIDLELHEAILEIDDANLEIFFFTPIILYIIQTIVSDYLSKEKRVDETEQFAQFDLR